MRRLRLLILAAGLLGIALVLVLPDVDLLDAAGVDVISASFIKSYYVPTPSVGKMSRSIPYFFADGRLEIVSGESEFVHPVLLSLLRC